MTSIFLSVIDKFSKTLGSVVIFPSIWFLEYKFWKKISFLFSTFVKGQHSSTEMKYILVSGGVISGIGKGIS